MGGLAWAVGGGAGETSFRCRGDLFNLASPLLAAYVAHRERLKQLVAALVNQVGPTCDGAVQPLRMAMPELGPCQGTAGVGLEGHGVEHIKRLPVLVHGLSRWRPDNHCQYLGWSGHTASWSRWIRPSSSVPLVTPRTSGAIFDGWAVLRSTCQRKNQHSPIRCPSTSVTISISPICGDRIVTSTRPSVVSPRKSIWPTISAWPPSAWQTMR